MSPAELALAGARQNVITLHSGALAEYQRKLEQLLEAIEQDIREGEPDHAAAIRDLIECITVRHDANAPQGIHIEVTGRLNCLLGDKAFPKNVGRIGGSGGVLPPFLYAIAFVPARRLIESKFKFGKRKQLYLLLRAAA